MDYSDLDFLEFVELFSSAYVCVYSNEKDDPIDDFMRILRFVAEVDLNKLSNRIMIQEPIVDRKSGYECFLNDVSERAYKLFPKLTIPEWRILIARVLEEKYGGTQVYFKKNPAASIKAAAKNMTPNELMADYGVSRSYAYKLRNSVLRKK